MPPVLLPLLQHSHQTYHTHLLDGRLLCAVPAQRRSGHGAAENSAGGGDGRDGGDGDELGFAAPASCS